MNIFAALVLEEVRLQVISEREKGTTLQRNISVTLTITSIVKKIHTAAFEVTFPSGQVTRLMLAALTDAARAMEAAASLKTIVEMKRPLETC